MNCGDRVKQLKYQFWNLYYEITPETRRNEHLYISIIPLVQLQYLMHFSIFVFELLNLFHIIQQIACES